MLFQLDKRQIGINSVVKNKKNKEIPSTPNNKFKFNNGEIKILQINWNLNVALSKHAHNSKKQIKEILLKFKAINLINRFSFGLEKSINKIPIIGNNNILIKIIFM